MPTNSSAYKFFIQHAKNHQPKGKPFSTVEKVQPGVDRDALRQNIPAIIARHINGLSDSFSQFCNRYRASGAELSFASDYEDLFLVFRQILGRSKAREVSFPQPNLSPRMSALLVELGVHNYLNDNGYSIVSQAQTRIFMVDFLWAETGMLQIGSLSPDSLRALHSEGENIFIACVSDCMANQRYQDYFNYADGGVVADTLSCTVKGGLRAKNHLIIVDNTRTNLLEDKEMRVSLACLRCGKCEAVCPVEKIVGKGAYDNIYTGPIAQVQLPFFEPLYSVSHLPFACTLCGACEHVCPMAFPITDWMLDLRERFWKDNVSSHATHKEAKNRELKMQKRCVR